MPKYSIIIPVYNRPVEVQELLESLAVQDFKDFELVIVEDGSSEACEHIIKNFAEQIDIRYFFKENTGPGLSRNFGMDKALGDWLLFFDSDCLIPPHYLSTLDQSLQQRPLDAFGGPDNAHESFSIIQKAINHSMTSVLTTGGIRGKKKQLDKFQPRSFNMGFTKEVYQKVGGFGKIHPGEDPDLSYRIMDAGFRVGLVPEAFVYHKRRIDFGKFYTQVYKFGVVRIILSKWHKGSFKLVYALPALFLLGSLLLLLLSLIWSPLFLIPLVLFAVLVFLEALLTSRHIVVSFLAVFASFIQLWGYGYGFLKACWRIVVLKKEERLAFPGMFFE